MSKKTQDTWRYAGKTLLRSVISTVLCAFLFLSMSVLSLGLFGQNVGYRITQQVDGGVDTIKEYYYQPGEAEVTSLELPEGQNLEQIREVPDGVQTGVDVVTQLIMLFIVCAFPYTMLWGLGDKDSTGVRYRGKKYNSLRGLEVGLLANVPYFLLYVLLVLSKFGLFSASYLAIYRLINLPFLPFINMVIPADITAATDASLWQLLGVLPVLLVIPAVCCVSYILGYKQISVQERVTYASVKKGNADTEI